MAHLAFHSSKQKTMLRNAIFAYINSTFVLDNHKVIINLLESDRCAKVKAIWRKEIYKKYAQNIEKNIPKKCIF